LFCNWSCSLRYYKDMDYNNIADTYARRRNVSKIVIDELCRFWRGSTKSRVLEVGCGTGKQLDALVKAVSCQGWGIDPSREMMKHAVENSMIRFSEGIGENIPFNDEFFNLVFSINTIHHMKDTPSYFREALRVLKSGGLICTATDSEKKIRNRKPLAQYWPGTVDIDLKRYPSITVLRQQMVGVGFVDIEEREIQETFEVTDATPYREKAFSCLHLIKETEFQTGLRHIEDDLKAGPIEGVAEFVCLWGRRLK